MKSSLQQTYVLREIRKKGQKLENKRTYLSRTRVRTVLYQKYPYVASIFSCEHLWWILIFSERQPSENVDLLGRFNLRFRPVTRGLGLLWRHPVNCQKDQACVERRLRGRLHLDARLRRLYQRMSQRGFSTPQHRQESSGRWQRNPYSRLIQAISSSNNNSGPNWHWI